METSILFMVLIAIVLIVLIFKFIKKVVVAVFSAVVVVILLFAGVIGLAVYDVKTLSEKTDFDTNIVYLDGDFFILGATLPVKDSQVDINNVKALSKQEYEQLNVEDLKKDGDKFAVVIQKESILKLVEGKKYTPSFTSEFEDLNGTVLEFESSEILKLVESENAAEELVDLILQKNNIDPAVSGFIKEQLVSVINSELEKQGLGVNEALFFDLIYSSIESNEINYLDLLSEYKDENINIYPNRLTFTLVKMLPSDIVQEQLENLQSDNTEQQTTQTQE